MKGTRIYINNLLHDPGWNFGVKAYDDFVQYVLQYGRTIQGVAKAIFQTAAIKKYHRINNQLIPQLRKDEYLCDVVRAALTYLPGCAMTVTNLMEILEPFNLSRTLVEKYLRYLQENNEIRIELQAGLENIYPRILGEIEN